MKAAWYERVGSPRDVFTVGEMVMSEPGPGDVVVEVHASGVNPSDTKRRSGWQGRGMAFPRIIPHSDGAGVITVVGQEVPKSRVGERVWLYNAQWGCPYGTAAEYIIIPSELAVPLPATTSFAEGACLGIPAMTAHRAVFFDGSVSGLTVLVAGGAGAVGNYAIQFACWSGATVLATVSSPKKAEIAWAAGAHHVLDYKAEDVAARVQEITGRTGVDRIIEVELGRNLQLDRTVLKPNGVIAAYSSDAEPEPLLPVYPLMTKAASIHFVYAYILPTAARQAAIADITTCLDAKILRHPIAARFALDDIATAHETVEGGQAIGKVVLGI